MTSSHPCSAGDDRGMPSCQRRSFSAYVPEGIRLGRRTLSRPMNISLGRSCRANLDNHKTYRQFASLDGCRVTVVYDFGRSPEQNQRADSLYRPGQIPSKFVGASGQRSWLFSNMRRWKFNGREGDRLSMSFDSGQHTPRAPREAVLVLGMHRSGTSSVAGALVSLGGGASPSVAAATRQREGLLGIERACGA